MCKGGWEFGPVQRGNGEPQKFLEQRGAWQGRPRHTIRKAVKQTADGRDVRDLWNRFLKRQQILAK